MKEQPNSDFLIKVDCLTAADSLELEQLLPTSYQITINHIVSISVTPELAATPWPPSWPDNYDHWDNAARAAEYLFATSDVTVAPGNADEVALKVMDGPELQHSAFFLPRAQFDALHRDVESIFKSPVSRAPTRLSEMADRPLARFLKDELPRAPLSDYTRRILCLPT